MPPSRRRTLCLAVLACLCLRGLPPARPAPAAAPDAPYNYTRPWVPKCCALHHGFAPDNRSACGPTEDDFLPDFDDHPDHAHTARTLPLDARYEYFIGDPCAEGKYILDLTEYPYDHYSLYTNGTLLYLDDLYSKEDYCLETFNGTVRAFICFGTLKTDHSLNWTFVIYATGLLISIPFLLATALIYLSVEMFRDLRGKSLSCHVLCLAIGYLVLAVVQLGSDQLQEDLCVAAGFIIQFFFVASFFWLNVICYDTYRCIANDFHCSFKRPNLHSEKITFYFYSLYGWYGPVMLSIVTLIMDFEPAIPESYLKPNIGLKSCWFYSDDAALPYFYGPVAIVILLNVLLFFLSARRIYTEHKARLQPSPAPQDPHDPTRDTRPSLRLYTKTLQECIYLFCIMGINWAAEVISWAVGGSQAIWLVTDAFNALQGVMIFYLFVLRPRRIRRELKRELCEGWKRVVGCDCSRGEEGRRVSRHCHANIQQEVEESSFGREGDRFLGGAKPPTLV